MAGKGPTVEILQASDFEGPPVDGGVLSYSAATGRVSARTAGSGGGGAVLIAQPWVANASVTAGQVVSQAAALYTAPTSFTAGATFNPANWQLGVAAGAGVYEQNGSGQVIAVWKGNGTGNAATKIMDVLSAGMFIPGGVWSAGTAYAIDTVVTRNGGGYLAATASTGIDPATDDGSHWQPIASKGDKGDVGPTGSPSSDGAIFSRHLADIVRPSNSGWMIGSGFAQNYRRDDAGGTSVAASRQLLSAGGLVLPGGRAVSAVRVLPTVVVGTPLHQFVAFYNARTLALLASGTDVTTQAMTANVDVTFPISYTPSGGLEVLVVYYCEATTAPTFAGKSSQAPATIAPRMGGLHDTLAAGSGPGALPATLGAAASGRGPFWLQVE